MGLLRGILPADMRLIQICSVIRTEGWVRDIYFYASFSSHWWKEIDSFTDTMRKNNWGAQTFFTASSACPTKLGFISASVSCRVQSVMYSKLWCSVPRPTLQFATFLTPLGDRQIKQTGVFLRNNCHIIWVLTVIESANSARRETKSIMPSY